MFRAAQPSDLPIGLLSPRTAFDYWGHPYWPQSRIANTFSEQRAALAVGLWIWEAEGEPDSIPSDHFLLSMLPVTVQMDELHDRLRSLQQEAKLSNNFPDIIWSMAKHIQILSYTKSSFCLAYLFLNSQPSNALLNALHAAFLCEALANHLGYAPETRQGIVSAALTMNWTILELQDRLSYQAMRPTASERMAILNHPATVESLLAESGVQNPIWLRCCLEHHEEPHGKGYPYQRSAPELIGESAILRCVDRYVALAVSRLHRFGMSTAESMAQLFDLHKSFDTSLIQALSVVIGPIAPGSLVELPSGTLARILSYENANFVKALHPDGSVKIEPIHQCKARPPSEQAPTFSDMECVRKIALTL